MSESDRPTATGACLCGALRYEIRGEPRSVVVCHCSRCLRWHGHAAAYSSCDVSELTVIDGDENLRWYSADGRERGFCAACGSSLFWRIPGDETISMTAGSLTPPTGLSISDQIFVDSAGDYYEVLGPGERHAEGLPDWPE